MASLLPVPPTPSPTRELSQSSLFLTLQTTPPSPQHSSAISDSEGTPSPVRPVMLAKLTPLSLNRLGGSQPQQRRGAFSISNPTTCAGDVFLSPSTAAASATGKRNVSNNAHGKAKRPAPMKLKIPALAQPQPCVSPTRSTLSVPPSPYPALPSPLYRIIEERYGTTPRGDKHSDATAFPFAPNMGMGDVNTNGTGVTYGSGLGGGITMSKSMQDLQFGLFAPQQSQMPVQLPQIPDTPYTPAGKSPTQATFLHIPSSPFTPPFTPPHNNLQLPMLEQPRPKSISHIPLPQPFLPPTPTSPGLTVPSLPFAHQSPAYDIALLPANLFPPGHKLLPDFLHRYALHASPELGSGGFGFVLLAQKRYGDMRDVAIKFIVKDKMPRHSWILDRDYGMLPIEITVLRLVKHENIVEFIEFFQDDVYFYLVQELHGTPWTPQPTLMPLPPTPTTPCPISPTSPFPIHPDAANNRPAPVRRASYDLFECIERHTRLSEDVARRIFRQVVDAVSYLHSLGIYHRDIKDENILIDQDFRVKLIDFGSAAITDTRKAPPYHDRFFGTMNFASSEILQNKAYQAPPAEIWTLGILLHILVTGECPFSSTQAGIEGRISPPRKGVFMSRDCEALVRGCLEVDVNKRLTIHEIQSHPWLMRN